MAVPILRNRSNRTRSCVTEVGYDECLGIVIASPMCTLTSMHKVRGVADLHLPNRHYLVAQHQTSLVHPIIVADLPGYQKQWAVHYLELPAGLVRQMMRLHAMR